MTILGSPQSTVRRDARSVASVGTVLGYGVRSALPFHYLRTGSGDPLYVTEVEDLGPEPKTAPLLEWLPREGHPLTARLYAIGGRYRLCTDQLGWFEIDPETPAITMSGGSTASTAREVALWGVPTALCAMGRGALAIHAAAVEVNGRAVLLAGPGRFGKTTLAAAFLLSGYRVLAEDVSCCSLLPQPTCLPGPAVIRLRRDSYERLEFPVTRVVVEEPDRVFLSIDDGLRGDGAPVRLAAIVLLRRGRGEARLEPLGALPALRDLWSLTFKLQTDRDQARGFQQIAELASQVPVWNLFRPMEFNCLARVVETVVETCAVD